MAVGRQDYQAGVVPIKSGYSLNQTPYVNRDGKSINPGLTADFCRYTPSVGYQLVVTGLRVTTSTPIINLCYVLIGASIFYGYYWDLLLIDNYPDSGSIIVKAGETIKLTISNADANQKWFEAMLIGVLEQIES